MNDTTVLSDPFIWVFNDVVPEQKCKEIIEKFDTDNSPRKVKGRTFGGVDFNIKNSTDLLIVKEPHWADIDIYFKDLVSFLINEYSQYIQNTFNTYKSFTTGQYRIFEPPLLKNVHDIGYQIQRTDVGDGYVWHNDYQKGRVLTYIVYLNTVDEGWTQFYNGDQVAPIAGRCLIFPATWTYFHQGFPPKQTKYLMTGWIYSDD